MKSLVLITHTATAFVPVSCKTMQCKEPPPRIERHGIKEYTKGECAEKKQPR